MRVGMLLADLHFGAVEPVKFTEEIYDIIDKIREMDQLDYIIFLGDVFDHKMYLGDPHIANLVMFVRTIVTIAINRGIKIRMIYGTESHECGQYILFKGYETTESLDFKIIDKVCDEYLFDDLRVLYVPEEYITESKSEYYKDYLCVDAQYDYVFGHGVIMEGMIMVKNDQSAQWMAAKSPKFTVTDFDTCLSGEVYFGHFHVHTDVTDRVHYVGSYSRWSHGEEYDKGYMIITKSGNDFSHEFIENPSATLYKTIPIGYNHPIFTQEDRLEDHIRGIDRMISVYPEGSKIKLVFNIPESYANPEFFMKYMKEKYRMHSGVILDFVNGYVDKKRQRDKEALHDTVKRYEYVIKKKDSIGEIVHKFIADKHGKDIPSDRIDIYLTQNLQDILNAMITDDEGTY